MEIIAGPCVIEDNVVDIAKQIAEISEDIIFKASFDKANRSSIHSFRGPGIKKGLDLLRRVKEETGLRLTTDIHEPWQAKPVAEVCDIIQIPAFLCRQTDLLLAAADTGKIVNIKKGQFMSPSDMKMACEKVPGAWVCERGTCFGYNDLVVDMRGILEMKEFSKVIFDATHSCKNPKYSIPLAKAALAVGVDGLFFEVHPDPDSAPCDGDCMMSLDKFSLLQKQLSVIRAFLTNYCLLDDA